jgi:hypothetical protein
MDLARAPCRAPLTARKMGSGYENGQYHKIDWHSKENEWARTKKDDITVKTCACPIWNIENWNNNTETIFVYVGFIYSRLTQ